MIDTSYFTISLVKARRKVDNHWIPSLALLFVKTAWLLLVGPWKNAIFAPANEE